jgi:hypothetical protein
MDHKPFDTQKLEASLDCGQETRRLRIHTAALLLVEMLLIHTQEQSKMNQSPGTPIEPDPNAYFDAV